MESAWHQTSANASQGSMRPPRARRVCRVSRARNATFPSARVGARTAAPASRRTSATAPADGRDHSALCLSVLVSRLAAVGMASARHQAHAPVGVDGKDHSATQASARAAARMVASATRKMRATALADGRDLIVPCPSVARMVAQQTASARHQTHAPVRADGRDLRAPCPFVAPMVAQQMASARHQTHAPVRVDGKDLSARLPSARLVAARMVAPASVPTSVTVLKDTQVMIARVAPSDGGQLVVRASSASVVVAAVTRQRAHVQSPTVPRHGVQRHPLPRHQSLSQSPLPRRVFFMCV